MMDIEALLVQDDGDMRGEALHSPLKFLAAGKGHIVGISRVLRTRGFCQTGQAAVGPKGANIGERW